VTHVVSIDEIEDPRLAGREELVRDGPRLIRQDDRIRRAEVDVLPVESSLSAVSPQSLPPTFTSNVPLAVSA
jgi:hypothetical protein